MIVPRLEGGLGNQLFIYAFARAAAVRSGLPLLLDTVNGYRADAYGRSYALDAFALEAPRAPEELVRPYRPGSVSLKWLRRVNRVLPLEWRHVLEERKLWEPRLRRYRPRQSVYLMGYWQREGYFEDCAQTLRGDFRFAREPDARNRELGEAMRAEESVFVHVRTQDYAHVLSPRYYEAALGRIRERVARPRFYVFADEPEAARARLPLGAGEADWITHNAGGSGTEDLRLMTQCRHAVVANSTFSWWGAWLGAHAGQVVVAPAAFGYRAAPAAGWETIGREGCDG